MSEHNNNSVELSFEEKVSELLKKDNITIDDLQDYCKKLTENAKPLSERLRMFINNDILHQKQYENLKELQKFINNGLNSYRAMNNDNNDTVRKEWDKLLGTDTITTSGIPTSNAVIYSTGNGARILAYYIALIFDLTVDQTQQLFRKVYFIRPFYVRNAIDAIFYTVITLKEKQKYSDDELYKLLNGLKKYKQNEEDENEKAIDYFEIRNLYSNSKAEFTRSDNEDNDTTIIKKLDYIIGSENPLQELENYLFENYSQTKNQDPYQHTALEKAKNLIMRNYLHFSCIKDTDETTQIIVGAYIRYLENESTIDELLKMLKSVCKEESIDKETFKKDLKYGEVYNFSKRKNLGSFWYGLNANYGFKRGSNRNSKTFYEALVSGMSLSKDTSIKKIIDNPNDEKLRKLLIASSYYDYYLADNTKGVYNGKTIKMTCNNRENVIESINEVLEKSGFNSLYEGDPYDAWFIICSSNNINWKDLKDKCKYCDITNQTKLISEYDHLLAIHYISYIGGKKCEIE